MPTCYLVGASPAIEAEAPRVLPGDFVIAADGGLDHLRRWGITPDFVVGDMDSLDCDLPDGVPCEIYPGEKDDTDIALALEEGLRRKFRRFEFIGASGGRPDHTMANMQLLIKAARLGAMAILHMGGWRCTALCAPSGTSELRLKGHGIISVFAYGDAAKCVTIAGMKYLLAGEILDGANPRGVSNELDGEGRISLKEGVLLCYWEEQIKVAP